MGYPWQLVVPNVYSGELVEADFAQLTNYWIFSPYRFAQAISNVATRFSHSIARCEHHAGPDLYVWDIHYAPSDQAAAVARVNELLGRPGPPLDLPLDLPLDVVGCILGFAYLTRPVLDRLLAEAIARSDVPTIATCIDHLGALRYADPELKHFLAHHAQHHDPEVRLAVAVAHLNAGHKAELIALRERETDAELREELAGIGDVPDCPQVIAHAIG